VVARVDIGAEGDVSDSDVVRHQYRAFAQCVGIASTAGVGALIVDKDIA
jgi:hypothetical protein